MPAMAHDVFQLVTVARVFTDGGELCEAVGFPEISAFDETDRKARACLQTKAKALLENPELAPALSLHRRRLGVAVEPGVVDVEFRPPPRTPDWEQPVALRVHFVRWSEGEWHHAVVPGLGVHVFATRPEAIPGRIEEHVRLLLGGRGRRVTLRTLAEWSRVEALRLGASEVSVQRKTLVQVAAAGAGGEEKTSVLMKLADELGPRLPRPGDVGRLVAESEATVEPAFELESELLRLAEVLSGPHRRSVLLVGAPGSGKTALVRELARRRREFGFAQTAFWSTTGARLMSGPIGYGMWQERCQGLCRELSRSPSILHLNHLEELLEVGRASRGEQSVGSFLRPWLARGEVLAIAECTPEQVGSIERREPQLLDAFQRVVMAERTSEQTRSILAQVLAAAAGREVRDPAANLVALSRLHELHQRYATYSANPGRPLRFLRNLLADRFPERQLEEAQVTAAFSRETGLPAVLLDDRVPLDLEATREWFAGRVVGQPEAVDRVVDLLVMIKARLARPRKPLGSFLFVGPTGTGKTEMAKALAGFLFGDASRLVRFDLNEFSDPLAVQRLMGGPLAGRGEGLLTARIREQPFSVVLLDEFEKADRSFFDLLLQILGDGRLTDAAGRVADFCNSVIVMTSNLGAESLRRGPTGFGAATGGGPKETAGGAHFADAVRRFLRPEIFNRLDALVPFRALTPAVVLTIARRQLEMLRQRDGVRLRALDWELGSEVAEHLVSRGYSEQYGARPLKRVMERELLVPLAEALNQYQEGTPLVVRVGVEAGRVRVQVRARSEGNAEQEGGSVGEAVQRWVTLRRRVSRMSRGAAVGRIEDEAALLEALERRLKRAGVTTPEFQARRARLPKLRECLRRVRDLVARVEQAETDALVAVYQREAMADEAGLSVVGERNAELDALAREVFRYQQEQPDDVIVAVFGEDRAVMLDLARAYHAMGEELGVVVGCETFCPPPGGRSRAAKLLREVPKKMADLFRSPPEKLLGIAMHLRGELFLARFGSESGIHVVRRKQGQGVCLVDTRGGDLKAYEPPAGVDRVGGIAARGA
ncbi:MAG: ATP-dependent Clp protease ATP-binding subunit, partial [Verrucomicrobiales bacterium]|nr:ATP-dependent Clp protease ATP-binding subunit [Verrucomicrobiales bacterium]